MPMLLPTLPSEVQQVAGVRGSKPLWLSHPHELKFASSFFFLTHTPKSKSGRPKNPGPATAAHRPFAPLNLCRRVIRPSRPLDRRRLHPIPAAPLLTAQSRCVYAEPPRPRPLPADARNTPSAVRIDHNTPFHRHLVPLSWTGLPLSRTPRSLAVRPRPFFPCSRCSPLSWRGPAPLCSV